MRTKFAQSLLAILVSGCIAPAVHASLESRDWQSAADGLLTLDTVTGLRWLDLSVTVTLPKDEVLAQLQPGGTYHGFRYATNAEVVQLWTNAGFDLSTQFTLPATPALHGGLEFMTGLLGDTMAGNSLLGYGATGVTAEPWYGDAGISDVMGVQYIRPSDLFSGFGAADFVGAEHAVGDNEIGHYLVSTPLPSAFWLFAWGLAGLGGVATRRWTPLCPAEPDGIRRPS